MKTDSKSKNVIIAISGYAGSGKDTLADMIIDSCVDNQLDIWISRSKFADALKNALNTAFDELGLDVDAFTEDREVKEKMRNCMVELGKYARSLDIDIFAKILACDIESAEQNFPCSLDTQNRYVTIISDMRYENEYEVMKRYCEKNDWVFVPIFIERDGFGPANKEEEQSIKKLTDKKADRFLGNSSFSVNFKTGDFKQMKDFSNYLVKNFLD
jgi:hypothetical protein